MKLKYEVSPAIQQAIKFLLLSLGVFSCITISQAKNIHGYYKKNGTYVASHHRSSANKTQRDNWSTKGNVNPYTGKKGTKEPKK